MPGIFVAKFGCDVIAQASVVIQNTNPLRPLPKDSPTHRKTQSFTNLEEPLLNCFPKTVPIFTNSFLFFLNQCSQRSLPTYEVEYKLSTFKLRPSKYGDILKNYSLLPNCNKNYGFDSKFGNKIALIAWYYKLNK